MSLLFPSKQPDVQTYLFLYTVILYIPYLCHPLEFPEDLAVSGDTVDEVHLKVPKAIAKKVRQVGTSTGSGTDSVQDEWPL